MEATIHCIYPKVMHAIKRMGIPNNTSTAHDRPASLNDVKDPLDDGVWSSNVSYILPERETGLIIRRMGELPDQRPSLKPGIISKFRDSLNASGERTVSVPVPIRVTGPSIE